MHPSSIKKLIDLFSKFPTVGPRTASRFIYYLIHLPKKDFEELVKALNNLKENIKVCSFCFNSFEPSKKEDALCPICQNKSRDKSLLCIVEKETDLISIENTKKYKGYYFILGGTVSNLKKEDIEKIRIEELKERIEKPENFGLKVDFKEVIVATNPTTEGETTALLLERKLKDKNIKITRLGRGLPTGGELEYADEQTLEDAFEGRK